MQDATIIRKESLNLFTKNKNRSISAMFRNFRKNKKYSWIGDYVILAEIIKGAHKLKIKTSRRKIWHSIQSSKELKGDSLTGQLLTQLEVL